MTDTDHRIDRLEERLAFAEVTIEELNQALINQQNDITATHILIQKLKTKTTQLEQQLHETGPEAPPPHY